MNLSLPEKLIKGDSFSLEGTLDVNITDWKIRCEIYDESGNSIKLATANSGGSDDDIEITDAENGIFVINVGKDETTNFDKKSFIEIEVETDDAVTKQFTAHQGQIEFEKQRIDWKIPS